MEEAVEEETYVVPHSLCEMGEMYMGLGRLNEAQQVLKTAKTYSHYDLDKPLTRRLMSALDQIS